MVDVSIVIPTLNEEESIGECIKEVKTALADTGIEAEVIVCDNSTDKTPQIAHEMGARVVVPDRMGYSYAVAVGIEESNGKHIFLADADGTYPISEMVKFIEPLQSGTTDLVIGSRYRGGIMKGAMPWLHRYIGNPLLTWTLNWVLGTKITDAHCGMRSFTRDTWGKMDIELLSKDFCSGMLKGAAINRMRISEVPIAYFVRNGNPKASTLVHGWRTFHFLFWHILLRR